MKSVFVNGVFDQLHFGHFMLFKYAASLGDFLTVAIDSDERVRQMKGYGRPYHNAEQRKFNLTSIKFIDEVLVFNSDESLRDLVKVILPDVMIVGEEYRDKKVIGGEFAKEIIYFERIKPFSSTEIINNGE